MAKQTCRSAAWVLTLACLIFGGQSALASSDRDQYDKPRVHAEGEFFHNDPANIPGGFSDKVKFGLNGRCGKNGFTTNSMGNMTCNTTRETLGEYDYHNEFTGLKAHGKLNSVVFKPLGDPDCAALVGATGPAATVTGGGNCTTNCTDENGTHHSNNFEMTVVDNGHHDRSNPDAVCKVFVSGEGKNHAQAADSDPGNLLNKGEVEVKTH